MKLKEKLRNEWRVYGVKLYSTAVIAVPQGLTWRGSRSQLSNQVFRPYDNRQAPTSLIPFMYNGKLVYIDTQIFYRG